MKRLGSSRASRSVLALAALLVLGHLATRAAGLADHTSILAGMPQSEWSAVLGPLYVLGHFAAVVGAPILVLAVVVEYLLHAAAEARVKP
jgi:hypothetical protein